MARLMRTLGTTQIGPMYDYKDMGMETAYENAFTIGSDMAAYGFNTDYAPVADVWTNPRTPSSATGRTATILTRRRSSCPAPCRASTTRA